jgi:transcriptional regulator with XRE-family HTH domain
MGLSQRAAAQALGMSLSGYQEQERGSGFDGKPREAPRVLLLACAAIEHGLEPVALD